jgi:hypothetical protein
MTDDTEQDIERYAKSATGAVLCCESLISSATNEEARKALTGIRDHLIEQAALWTRYAREHGAKTAHTDAVLFGNPAVLEAAIRDRLTPGQCAQLAERLAPKE